MDSMNGTGDSCGGADETTTGSQKRSGEWVGGVIGPIGG